MGASLVYLEKPNTAVEFASGEDERLRFAAGEMQGWRLNMVSHLFFIQKQFKLGITFKNILRDI